VTINKYKSYLKLALQLKIEAATLILTSSITVAEWVLEECRKCSGYGKCLTCPPYTPLPKEMEKTLDAYEFALLLHGYNAALLNSAALQLEKTLRSNRFTQAKAFGCGPCYLCEDCPIDSGQCKFPKQARASMEACGIDVFTTVKAHGFPIERLKSATDKANFYALVLIE